MIGISFRFPGGQYHATPWQRHVNEAAVEWPPSPWRIVRALIAVWYRKGGMDYFDAATLKSLVYTLTQELPDYQLPQAVHTNVRHYMPIGGIEKTALIYDGFLRINPNDALIIRWPNLSLTEPEAQLLQYLVERIGYLGRAESWVEARLIDERLIDTGGLQINCGPLDVTQPDMILDDAQYRDVPQEVEKVLAPMTLSDYEVFEKRANATGSSKQSQIPERLFEALSVDTNDLERAGRLQPPGSKWVLYTRPSLEQRATGRVVNTRTLHANCVAARFAFLSRFKPRIEETIDVGDVFHMALIAKFGDNPPSMITGRLEDGRLSVGHKHLFILPEDADHDGFIDHITITASDPFPEDVVSAITGLKKLWTPTWWSGPRREWNLFLEGFMHSGDSMKDSVFPLIQSSKTWVSKTPYLHPWFRKKHGMFGPEDQIRRELVKRGLPEPTRIQHLPELKLRGRMYQTRHFRRYRRTKQEAIPDTQGSFWEIEFPQAIDGPLALGVYCHFGLGMFAPLN